MLTMISHVLDHCATEILLLFPAFCLIVTLTRCFPWYQMVWNQQRPSTLPSHFQSLPLDFIHFFFPFFFFRITLILIPYLEISISHQSFSFRSEKVVQFRQFILLLHNELLSFSWRAFVFYAVGSHLYLLFSLRQSIRVCSLLQPYHILAA